MHATASPLLLDRYALFDKIGSGGMATVHLGRIAGAAGFSRMVAIKRLHPHLADEPGFVSMFVDEARLAARIHHPNVVQTLDVVASGGHLLIVMEYVEGASLSRLWRAERERGQRLALPIASAIVCGLLQGLHAAHEARDASGVPLGLVHRDVSPQNVIVGVDGVARVLDFGVAKAVGRLQTTSEGVVKGKLGYMAAEQARGRPVTRQADVYSAAVILWELIAGRRLFTASSDAEMLLDVLSTSVHAPGRHAPGVPRALDALVLRGLASRPAERFPTARAMADALARAVPPAQPHEVGRWVERMVGEELVTRRTRISQIERDPGDAPSTVPRPSLPAPQSAASTISGKTSVWNKRGSWWLATAIGAGVAGVTTVLALSRSGRDAPPRPPATASAVAASSIAAPVETSPVTSAGPTAWETPAAPPAAAVQPAPTATAWHRASAPTSSPAPARAQPVSRPRASAVALPATLPLSPD